MDHALYAALAAQVVLLLLLALGWGRIARALGQKTAATHPPISVVMCMHNEAHNAAGCLKALGLQQYPDFEIVVVNDRSTDDTPAMLQALARQDARIRIVNITELPAGWTGKKHAVQTGIAHARYEHLAFTDADCVAPTQWLAHIAAQFARGKNVVLGYGPYSPAPGLLNKLIRYDAFAIAAQYMGWAAAGLPYMAVGRNLAYTKQAWQKAGGFARHAATPSGDDDIWMSRAATNRQLRIGIMAQPQSFVYSRPKQTVSEVLRQKSRHLGAGLHYGWAAKGLIGVWALSQYGMWLMVLGCLIGQLLGHAWPAQVWGGVAAWAGLKTAVWLWAAWRLQSVGLALGWVLLEPLQLALQALAWVVFWFGLKRAW
jgi:cellulose synthase/poly-beta-1,6-N-acetylglucosamine synthase-like glycosyltransferase